MNQRPRYLVTGTLLLAGFFLACGGSRTISDTQRTTPNPPEHFSPNTCRIIGKIVSIDTSIKTTDTLSPCFKGPCRARVHIDSLLGCGMAFPEPLYPGEEITAFFIYTLNPTQDVFPMLPKPLPGLQPGSRFAANVIGHPAPKEDQIGNNTIEFSVYDYSVLQ